MHPARFVHRQIDHRVVDDDPGPVDPDLGGLGIHRVPNSVTKSTVHLDPAVDDHPFGNAPRGDSNLRQHFLEPNTFRVSHGNQPSPSVSTSKVTGLSADAAPANFANRGSLSRLSADVVDHVDIGQQRCDIGQFGPTTTSPAAPGTTPVVENVVAPESGSVPASVISPLAAKVRITASQFTPRTALTRARVTGCR